VWEYKLSALITKIIYADIPPDIRNLPARVAHRLYWRIVKEWNIREQLPKK
jgi:hypothetical protein